MDMDPERVLSRVGAVESSGSVLLSKSHTHEPQVTGDSSRCSGVGLQVKLVLSQSCSDGTLFPGTVSHSAQVLSPGDFCFYEEARN